MKLMQLLRILIIYAITYSVSASSGPQAVERIVGGQEPKQGELPHLAFLYISNEDQSWNCTGCIIGSRNILTAGRCTFGAIAGYAIVGATDVTGAAQPGTQKIQLDKNSFKTHEEYNQTEIKNDIGLIKTPTDIIMNKNVKPVSLPDTSSQPDDIKLVKFAGFGYSLSVLGLGIGAGKLRYGYGTTNFLCQSPNGQVCVTGLQSICYGDSGGPLTTMSNNIEYVEGIASLVNIFCTSGPNSFTSVRAVRGWIREISGI